MMETVEVKILKYTLKFRHLSWREEASIRFEKGADRMRVVLAHALVEVSGLNVATPEEAKKVLDAIPTTVMQRILVLWKGSLPMPRRFSTTGLYAAPTTENVARRLQEVEQSREKAMDKVEAEMRQKFGDKEIEETLALERQMIKNSKMRGATKATPDEALFGAAPPPKAGKNAK